MSGNTSLNSTQIQSFFSESQLIALNIFEEYIRKDAPFEIQLSKRVKCSLFQKFGCPFLGNQFDEIYEEKYEKINHSVSMGMDNPDLFDSS